MATFLLLNREILRFPSSSSTPEEILRLFREHLETKFWTNMLLKAKIGGKSFGIYSIIEQTWSRLKNSRIGHSLSKLNKGHFVKVGTCVSFRFFPIIAPWDPLGISDLCLAVAGSKTWQRWKWATIGPMEKESLERLNFSEHGDLNDLSSTFCHRKR